MAFTPPSKESSNNSGPLEPDPSAAAIVRPLLQQCRLKRPGLMMVSYRLGPPAALIREARGEFETAGFAVEEARFTELAPDPVAELLRRRGTKRPLVFFIHFPRRDPGVTAAELGPPINALNLQRGVFFNEGLCAVLWVRRENVRLMAQHASNFLDFRLRFLEVEGEPEPKPPQPRTLHNLPFPPLPFFMGRERELERVRQTLATAGTSAITQTLAFEGLGGVGKTRLALEYAWRQLADYDAVLFLRADSPLSLHLNLGDLAELLDLPEAEATDGRERLEAVLGWLETHDRWLAIIDNADAENAADAVKAILPRLHRGHVIITSRFRRWEDEATRVSLELFNEDQAAAFLLEATWAERREGAFEQNDARDAARALASNLGCLPLALALAAAYIRTKNISLADYVRELESFRPASLAPALSLTRPAAPLHDYPDSVQACFLRSLAALDPDAKAVLFISAWLAPDPIPEQLFSHGKTLLETAARDLHATLDQLFIFSMIDRKADAHFSVHRLLQEVVRESLSYEAKRDWAGRAVTMIADFIPKEYPPDDVRSWGFWNPMYPHVKSAAENGDRLGLIERIPDLMNAAGLYLLEKASYQEAEPLMRRALSIDEAAFGPDHPNVAIRLNNLAALLQATNRLSEAEPLMRRTLAIAEASFGPDHPDVAIALNNLATLLQATNRLSEAEPMMRRALAIAEAAFGPDHPMVAIRLNNLTALLQATNRFSEAEPLMKRVVEIFEKSLGEGHPNVATALNNFAQLLKATNRLSEAEPLMRRALSIDEAAFGPDHPMVARDLNNLAQLLKATNRLSEAEPLMRRALSIDEAAFGPDHPMVAIRLNNLAQLLQATNRLSEAEPLMRRALGIMERSYRDGHPSTVTVRKNLEALEAKLRSGGRA